MVQKLARQQKAENAVICATCLPLLNKPKKECKHKVVHHVCAFSHASEQPEEEFPQNAVGLDSWANVYLIHEDVSSSSQGYSDTLGLACGDCSFRKEIGRKGIPCVYVPRNRDGSNIDLFPEGILWERGCTIVRADHVDDAFHILITPQGRVIDIKMWRFCPYITKAELQIVIDDLPSQSTHTKVRETRLVWTGYRNVISGFINPGPVGPTCCTCGEVMPHPDYTLCGDPGCGHFCHERCLDWPTERCSCCAPRGFIGPLQDRKSVV